MPFLDHTIVLLLPALVFALWAQAKVKRTYAEFPQVPVRAGLRGADVAQLVLRDAEELAGARAVLTAAAMTYVATVAMAMMKLIRLLAISRD